MQSQYNRSLQVAEEQMAQRVSPTTRRLTRLDVDVQPAKQLNIAGYGGMVSSSAPVVSDGEEEDEDAEESDQEEEDNAGGTAAQPLDGLIGTCLPGTPSKQGRASEITSADSSPTASAESSPTKAAESTGSTGTDAPVVTGASSSTRTAPPSSDGDAFLALQNKRYESMQTLGEMAIPGSSKPLALPAPPPIKTIEIATEAPRPTTGKGYFSFILSAASASNEAAVADRQHLHHPQEKQLLLCNGEHHKIPEEVCKEEDEDSTTSDHVVAPLSPASPDELMDVDDDDGSDCSGFSDLDIASTSSPIGAGAAAATAIVPITPASRDELMDVDDYSDSDLDPDDDTTSANTNGKINMTQAVDTGVTWRDDSKKHQVQPHQYHRTRGNIAFRAPKFFRDGPDLAAPAPSAPATDVGGSSTKLSAIASPLSPDSVDSPSPSSKYTLAVMSSSTAATAAAVSSDIVKEGGDVDHDFSSPLDDPAGANSSKGGTKKGKKSWKKSLGKKLRITRKKKKADSPSSGGDSTADDTAEPSPEGYAQSPTQNQSEYGNNPYDELYSDDDEEDGLACPEDLEMPGLHVVPAATSTALVVASSSVDDEDDASYKEHQKRPDLDKFRHPEASQKKMTPFSMWYDGEEDLVVNGRGDESVLTDDEAPAEENALVLVPSPSNKSQSPRCLLRF